MFKTKYRIMPCEYFFIVQIKRWYSFFYFDIDHSSFHDEKDAINFIERHGNPRTVIAKKLTLSDVEYKAPPPPYKIENKRYFLVFYRAFLEETIAVGWADVISEEGYFLNEKQTLEDIKSINKDFTQIVFTNIIELSSKDFEDWINENK